MRPTRTSDLRIEVPKTRRERRRGLLGRDGLSHDRAMLLPRVRLIHTVGMRFPILVAFLDRSLTVIETRIVPPGRVAGRLDARHVLECAVDADVRVGDRLA